VGHLWVSVVQLCASLSPPLVIRIHSNHVLFLCVVLWLAPVDAAGDEGSTPNVRPDNQFGAAVVALASAFAALAALAPAHAQESLEGVRAQLVGLQSVLAAALTSSSDGGSTYGSAADSGADSSAPHSASEPDSGVVRFVPRPKHVVPSPASSSRSLVPAVARLFADAEARLEPSTLPALRGGGHDRGRARCSAGQFSSSSDADVPRRGIAAAWGRGRGRASTSASASDEDATGSRDRRTERSRAHAERSRTHAVCAARVRTLLLSRAFACFRSAALSERAADACYRDAIVDGIPRSSWLWLLYVCRLRARARRSVLSARIAAILLPSPHVRALRYVRKLRRLAARRRHILGHLDMSPRPMYAYDVGYEAATGVFSFRDPCGRVSLEHPAAPSSAPRTIPAYSDRTSVCRRGDVVPPLSPPPSSSVVLCPDTSGAWCYYDSASGRASWFPPDGSTPLASRSLLVASVPSTPPPRLDESFCTGMLGSSVSYRFSHVDWITVYRDCGQRPLYAHRTTGSVREGPWIALRSTTGCAYYANLVTQVTRWFPPPLWMEGWVSRIPAPPVAMNPASLSVSLIGGRDGDRPFDSRSLLPVELARLRVEGGAPHLHERGLPQYPRDLSDTEYTYPACTTSPAAKPSALAQLAHELPSPAELTTSDTTSVSSDCAEVEADLALGELAPEAEAWVLGRGEPDSFAELASAQLLELPSSPLAVRAALLLQRTVRAYWYARDELEQDSLALALEEYGYEEPELLVTRDTLLMLCASSRYAGYYRSLS